MRLRTWRLIYSTRLTREQFDRYKTSLNNLIIADYLNFQFFVDGVLSTTISIGHIENGRIVSESGNFDTFIRRLTEFCSYTGQTITSAQKLAKLMAAKARLLADVIELALSGDQGKTTSNLFEEANSTLRDQLEAFKRVLNHDITVESFADMYAQTIAYGMFAARLGAFYFLFVIRTSLFTQLFLKLTRK